VSQQQQQQLVMLVIIITHPVLSTACLYAFSFSADRVVLAPFLIGTALARSLARTFLYCAVWCDDDDNDQGRVAHICPLLPIAAGDYNRCVRSVRTPCEVHQAPGHHLCSAAAAVACS